MTSAFRFLILCPLIVLIACADTHSEDALAGVSGGVVSVESLNAFQSTLYTFGQNQGCVNCHATRTNPRWMNDDINMAYVFAKAFVDFNNPSASVFVNYAGNNHCSDPICANPANRAVVNNLLIEWADAELAQGAPVSGGTTLPNPPFFTQTLAIPNPLPLITARNPAVIRFDLSQLTPQVPALVGAILEISIQSYNTAQGTSQGEYKVFNPRIAGNSVTVTITGIHVYVRPAAGTGLGLEDVTQGTLWSNLNVVSSVQPLPNPLPSGPMTGISPLVNYSLGIASQSAADVITIGFANIQ